MDDEAVVQRGLDLLNLMAMDPDSIWEALGDANRTQVAQALQRFSAYAEAVDHEQDGEQAMQTLIRLAADVMHLVHQTPELTMLLLPDGESGIQDNSGVLGAWLIDLGNTENERRAQAQKFAIQMRNSLVLIRKAEPQQRMGEQHHLNRLADEASGTSFSDLFTALREPGSGVDPQQHDLPATAETGSATGSVYALTDSTLFATFYGQRGTLLPLARHLIEQCQLVQSHEHAMTFSNETSQTMFLPFDSPGAADTSVIQLIVNSAEPAALAWPVLREHLAAILNDALLHWPVYGYSLVYQAMLVQAPEPGVALETVLGPTLQALLPVVQPLQAGSPHVPLLAASTLPWGMLSLHHLPLDNDGLAAATVYVALSLPDSDNQFVRQVLMPPGGLLLMPDLIAQKIYHQIRQYRSGGWLEAYNHLVETLRSDIDTVLNPHDSDAPGQAHVAALNRAYSELVSRVHDLNALQISLSQQQQNYPSWVAQFPGDTTVVQYHQRYLEMALSELALHIEKGQNARDSANAALESVHRHWQIIPEPVPSQQVTYNHPIIIGQIGQGTFVAGDQFTMSGNFTGAMLTIKSTLEHVSQNIANAPQGDSNTKEQLQQLIVQLNAELQNIPADRAGDAEQVARRAEAAVEAATAPTLDREDVQYHLDSLAKAAANIGAVLPAVLSIVEQIVATVGRMIA